VVQTFRVQEERVPSRRFATVWEGSPIRPFREERVIVDGDASSKRLTNNIIAGDASDEPRLAQGNPYPRALRAQRTLS